MPRKSVFVLMGLLLVSFLINVNILTSRIRSTPLEQKDLDFTAEANLFGRMSEYELYFGIDRMYFQEEDYEKERKNVVKLNFAWELSPEKRVKDDERLYYTPWIVVIPVNSDLAYKGTNRYTMLTSISKHINDPVIKNAFKERGSQYGWEELTENRFAWVLRPKSFEQGKADMAIELQSQNSGKVNFKTYFIYYDPKTRDGLYIEKDLEYVP